MKYILLILFSLSLLGLDAQETCLTPSRAFVPVPAATLAKTPDGVLCSKVFVQVDADIVADKGLFGAITWATDLMAEVAVPYADINIELSFDFQFLETEIYTDGGSYDLLRQFQANLPTFPGDHAILLSYKASGGIAWVDQVCTNSSFRYSFASLRPTYQPYRDGYSWNVEVVAHELGHLFGSGHTQDCLWNGDGTPIDGCYPVAGCPRGPIPTDGGTIMSYCHLVGGVGINFDKGFHPQVAAVMRTSIFQRCADCAIPDDPDDDDPDVTTCEENTIFLNLILDAWPDETSYEVSTPAGEVVFQSLPFTRAQAGKVIADTLCLPDGCYTYTITDSTGLAPHPEFSCVEGMYYVGDAFGEFGSGQDFSGSETVQICLNSDPPADDCEEVPTEPLLFYANQHRGGSAIQVPGGVQLDSNTWRAIPYEFTTTPNTILKGEIKIDRLGEIHGIAFVDNIRFLSPSNTMRFAGTQRWGREVEQIPLGGWHSFEISVGQVLPNWSYTHFVLVNDKDPNGQVTTTWRNLELCETPPGSAKGLLSTPKPEGKTSDEFRPEAPRTGIKHPNGEEAEHETFGDVQRDINERVQRNPFPNPVTDTLQLPGPAAWFLFYPTGQLVEAGFGSSINMTFLPPGIYTLWQAGVTHKIVKK